MFTFILILYFRLQLKTTGNEDVHVQDCAGFMFYHTLHRLRPCNSTSKMSSSTPKPTSSSSSSIRIVFRPSYSVQSAVLSSVLFMEIYRRAARLRDLYLWLSTMGAAHFALGAHDDEHAVSAAAMSLKQARVAYQLRDFGLYARCLMYHALARALQCMQF